MNIVQLNEQLKSMPMEQLIPLSKGQNPQIPSYLAMAALQYKTEEGKRLAAAQNAQEPQTTVSDDVVAAAGVPPGRGGIGGIARSLAPKSDMGQLGGAGHGDSMDAEMVQEMDPATMNTDRRMLTPMGIANPRPGQLPKTVRMAKGGYLSEVSADLNDYKTGGERKRLTPLEALQNDYAQFKAWLGKTAPAEGPDVSGYQPPAGLDPRMLEQSESGVNFADSIPPDAGLLSGRLQRAGMGQLKPHDNVFTEYLADIPSISENMDPTEGAINYNPALLPVDPAVGRTTTDMPNQFLDNLSPADVGDSGAYADPTAPFPLPSGPPTRGGYRENTPQSGGPPTPVGGPMPWYMDPQQTDLRAYQVNSSVPDEMYYSQRAEQPKPEMVPPFDPFAIDGWAPDPDPSQRPKPRPVDPNAPVAPPATQPPGGGGGGGNSMSASLAAFGQQANALNDDIGKEFAKDKWMALAQAGFAMMSEPGTLAEGIGRGGQAGLAYLGQARDKRDEAQRYADEKGLAQQALALKAAQASRSGAAGAASGPKLDQTDLVNREKALMEAYADAKAAFEMNPSGGNKDYMESLLTQLMNTRMLFDASMGMGMQPPTNASDVTPDLDLRR